MIRFFKSINRLSKAIQPSRLYILCFIAAKLTSFDNKYRSKRKKFLDSFEFRDYNLTGAKGY